MVKSEPLLVVKDLNVYFQTSEDKKYALKDIHFSLEKGGILGIVGETGSGKSVLAQSIMNLVQPGVIESGEIWYKNRDVLKMTAAEQRKIRGKDISMIFADPATCFDPLYSIGDQIVETIISHEPMSKRLAKERAIELLELVGIPSPHKRINDYPYHFSGGMIQRAMIAAAISSKPELIIADNPTQALDVTIQAQILELLFDLKERLGTTIIFISHSLGVISQMAEDVMVLYAGSMLEYGEKNKVLHGTRHPYTKLLIESIPKMTGDRLKKLQTIPGSRTNELGVGCSFRARCPIAIKECEIAPSFAEVESRHQVACWNTSTVKDGIQYA